MSNQDSFKLIALEQRVSDEERLISPSAERNTPVIVDVFKTVGITTGTVLEIGAGTGQHASHLMKAYPDLTWHAVEPDVSSAKSVVAWSNHLGVSNQLAGVYNVGAEEFRSNRSLAALSAVYSANVIHISPISVMKALVGIAASALGQRGKLVLYGPFSRHGQHTAPSNAEFDKSLKARDPSWGVRDLDHDLVPEASQAGLTLTQVLDMPANNNVVVFERKSL